MADPNKPKPTPKPKPKPAADPAAPASVRGRALANGSSGANQEGHRGA